MTWTYGGNPAEDDVDAVRYRIQDTDEDRPLITDEEIEYELDEADDDILQAALSCAEVLVARGAHKVTKKINNRQINYSDLTAQYRALVDTLREKIARSEVGSYTIPSAAADIADRQTADSEYPVELEHTDLGRL